MIVLVINSVSSNENNSLISEIEKNKDITENMYYFSKTRCQTLSDGAHQSLKLKSILNIIQCQKYTVYLTAIYCLQKLIIGHIPHNNNNKNKTPNNSVLLAFNKLTRNEKN